MQRARKNAPKPTVSQKRDNFFQKPRNQSTNPTDLKSTRAAEETGNEFFFIPTIAAPKPPGKASPSKPFNKKAWRLQKYSKKYKLDQWENRRRTTVLREYYRQIDPNEKKLDVEKIYQQYDDQEEEIRNTEITVEETDNNLSSDNVPRQSASTANGIVDIASSGKIVVVKSRNAFHKARDELARMKEEKRIKKTEFLQRKQEKEEKLKLYNQQKAEKFKKLNKKTKRGQPIMKDRIEMLLEQIQNNM